ncbi:cytidine deaminase [Sphingobium baderi]|uniref:Cytidine deaminase n=1 Tax=Sphingobium baderi TaxID=1332080 RepID=A0A0S3F4D0_9SPHN|nr:cytidine deaminase [Sphingobium baderi]ALR22603.1 cytidine deaminase [Sphingobium baderi]
MTKNASAKALVAKALVDAAREAMAHAHAPYSGFAVGAAVRLTDGRIVTGANFENASYGLSLCAETVALATVNSQGRLADVEAIAVAGGADGAIVAPCGRCRQVMHEAEQIAGRPLPVYCAAASGEAMIEHSVSALLPYAFGPADLGVTTKKRS